MSDHIPVMLEDVMTALEPRDGDALSLNGDDSAPSNHAEFKCLSESLAAQVHEASKPTQ